MTQEQAEKKLNNEPQLQYAIRGLKIEDGNFYLDAALGYSRDDIRSEAKKFISYQLYKLVKDENQNL